MRKWAVIGLAMVLAPWMVTLGWIRVSGSVAEAKTSWEGREEGLSAGDGSGAAAGDENLTVRPAAENGENGGQEPEASDRTPAGVTVGVSPAGRKRILMERDGIQTYMDLEIYLPGVIACQIPEREDGTDWNEEVWKCQAVIARTYINRLMEGRSEIYEDELDMDYLGDSSDLRAAGREAVMKKLEQAGKAAKETAGVVMKYEDRYILPLFHEMSAGRTRTGEADFPYLVSADSGQDTKRSEYLQRMEWSPDEFAAKINEIPDAAPVSAQQLASQIQTVRKDDAGYILQMKIGARIYTGDDIQYALGLPSPCFRLEADEDVIRALVRGRGHGYGLSQSGADSMAEEGWGYEDILNHYYKNISLIFE